MKATTILAPLLAGLLPFAANACSLAATELSFGPIDPLQDAATTSVGRVQVECEADTPYSIRLSPGASGSWDRRMHSGSDPLFYNLFRDPGHYEIWGDGSGGSLSVSGTGSGDVQTHYVYGRIPSQPTARVGRYADDIVVTLEF